MTALLEIHDLVARYGGVTALRGITLSVRSGSLATIIGANGAGKSTLLRCVMGVKRPSSGTISFDGLDITGTRPSKVVRHGLAMVPEGRQLFPGMSVTENLQLGHYAARAQGHASHRMDEVFDHFPKLAERRNQLAGTMSGGEQQMVAMGRALMASPRVMLLDEPTLGLAPQLAEGVLDALIALRDSGMTTVLIEQNAAAALEIADDAYVLERGTVATSGPAADLVDDPDVAAAYLGIA